MKFLTTRYELGYAGMKKTTTPKRCCTLVWCNNPRTMYKGTGEALCEEHQRKMRIYGGKGRVDRPWTFNAKDTCAECGYDPNTHPMVIKAREKNKLVADCLASGKLIIDHIIPQRDAWILPKDHEFYGNMIHAPGNCKTLCLDCNDNKTMLSGDSVPRGSYSTEKDYAEFMAILKPVYEYVYGYPPNLVGLNTENEN